MNEKSWSWRRSTRYIKKYKELLGSLFAMLWACCSPVVKTEIKEHVDYDTVKKSRDFMGMLNIVDAVCHTGTFGTRLPPTVKTVDSMFKILCMGQKQT